jgi:Spy/CpxP family protein refolding chaperone
VSRGTLKFLLTLSVLLNLSVVATAGYKYYAQGRSWTSPYGVKMDRDRFIFEQLSLSHEQMKAMRQKAVPFRAAVDRQREAVVALRKELIALLRADAPDATAIEATIARISGLQEQLQQQITRQMLEQKALLRPEQQKAFLDLIERTMAQGGQAE